MPTQRQPCLFKIQWQSSRLGYRPYLACRPEVFSRRYVHVDFEDAEVPLVELLRLGDLARRNGNDLVEDPLSAARTVSLPRTILLTSMSMESLMQR